ncbi:MAG: hypothetical protein L0Y72_18270 [Gemmataceae bacterium]|nr:hypothetical protein [Gemmataceae bacterium]MCI0740997.1 hypothetical protein [Gemmataceae bacterium]
MDAFLDRVFELSRQVGKVIYFLVDDATFGFHKSSASDSPRPLGPSSNSVGNNLHQVNLKRAKTKLRMLCARLAARCSDWSGKSVSPYGDSIDIEVPSINPHTTNEATRCHVDFKNTADAQWIAVSSKLAPRVKRKPTNSRTAHSRKSDRHLQ